jgi:amino acid transporter
MIEPDKNTKSALRQSLTTPKIVFLVVAAAAPLAAMVGNLPIALALGNGAGTPGAFLLATITLLCFAVGYAFMSRRVVHTGAFYTYVGLGLGRAAGIAGAFIAVIAYCAMTFGLVGGFAYFAELVSGELGIPLSWEVFAGLAIGAVAVLGYRQIDVSARILSVLMVAEILMLLVLDLAVLAREGLTALPAQSFSAGAVFSGAPGVALMIGFLSFIGFESAALYGEEARNPRRSVPLATYTSVVLVGTFYCLTSWIAVGATGSSRVQQVAGQDLGSFLLNLERRYVGAWAADVMALLVVTSVFAALLALHNAASRYIFVLGRESILPARLGQAHARHGSPHAASVALTLMTVCVTSAFAAAGLDPYIGLATTMTGLGTLGIIILQALAALAIVAFFRKRGEAHWWKTLVAPLLGFLGLAAASALLVENFSVLTNTSSLVVNAMPWLYVAAVAAGLTYALWLRSSRPERYSRIAVVPEVSSNSAAVGATDAN